jgi:hypothetical protein
MLEDLPGKRLRASRGTGRFRACPRRQAAAAPGVDFFNLDFGPKLFGQIFIQMYIHMEKIFASKFLDHFFRRF